MFDNTCKFIAANFSRDLAAWLLGESVELTVLEPTELFVEPIRADSVIFLQSRDIILHIEFQTDPKDDVPFRMADYLLRLYRLFPQKMVYQVVIYLRRTNSQLARKTTFDLAQMHHRYQVIRLWEVSTQEFLEAPGLLPFAVLSQTRNPAAVLERVARQIEGITDRAQQSNVAAATAIIAGLVLDTMVIKRLLREEIMKESVIYQEIEATSEARGLQRGRQEEAVSLILRLLHRRLGEIPVNSTEQIRGLSVEQLENLGEALLDFQSLSALGSWLDG